MSSLTEIWYSITMKVFVILLSSLSVLVCASCISAQEKRQYIRFYKLNNKDQQVRIQISDKTSSKAGCNNFLTKPRIYRLTQIGFDVCRVYSEKNCAADSIVEGLWKGEKTSSELSQGGEWLFTSDNPKGTKLKSWACE